MIKTLFKTAIFTIFFPGTVVALVPYFILKNFNIKPWTDSMAFHTLGFLFLGIGLFIYLWCAWEFAKAHGTPHPIAPPKELVINGLYQYTRNPMYLGMLCVLIGEAFFFKTAILICYAVLVFIMFELFILIYEEPKLLKIFGQAYEKYRNTVPRWLC